MIADNAFKLTFLGGAGTVTGSKTLVEFNDYRVLIDCGLFQGLKELRLLNRAPFPIPSKSIDTIILTHAHLDHCGYLPVLFKNGFRGEIHCTKATRDLAEIILMDSAKIQEEDAERANQYNYTKHNPATPLYTTKDVLQTLDHFVEHDFNEWVILHQDFKFEFLNNGHILGSGLVNARIKDKKVVFSGDMGQSKPMLMYPPKKVQEIDYLVMESTYGNRIHQEAETKEELLRIVEETLDRKGILMIPSFAVERTQELLYLIYQLRKEDRFPSVPVYLDSPMGINATKVYSKFSELQNISRYEITHMYDEIKFISDAQLSKAICLDKKPKVILAGSGMIEGGRIVHYLNNHMSNENNTLLFVGYQGAGTRGRAILNGEKSIKFFGEFHTVKCHIENLTNLSAHGDQNDLIEWMKHIKTTPKKVFLNHGEPDQSKMFRDVIEKTFGWDCAVPEMYQEFLIED